jgi:hypothetical protein
MGWGTHDALCYSRPGEGEGEGEGVCVCGLDDLSLGGFPSRV